MDNLINKKINSILILERIGRIKEHASNACYYKCVCDCGKTFNVRASYLRNNNIKSCGCIGKHYMTNAIEYTAWSNMKNRCLNKKTKQYKDYGGRGISICNRWLDFTNFINDMGYSNGLTLERIDVNGNYEPKNCKWATRQEQSLNTRNSKYVIENGEKISLKELANKNNIKYPTLLARFNKYGDLNLNKKVFVNNINGVFCNSYSEVANMLNEERRKVQYQIERYGSYRNFTTV